MGFLTVKFFIFLPIVLVLYYAVGKKGKCGLNKIVLILASMLYFFTYGAESFLVLTASTVFNLLYSRFLLKNRKPLFLGIGIVINVLPLILFKYLNFFAENIARIVERDFSAIDIILPVAISYYTFQMISWTVDSYRGETEGEDVLDFLAYVWFFPRMILGPITRHEEFVPQVNDEKKLLPDPENIATGFVWFTVGMSKKLLLASRFGTASTYGFLMGADLSLAEGWLCSIAYTLEIYLDFSGYCDMAAGVSKMFNIDIPVNFMSPYKADSVSDFWKRWHISLTSFLRKYVYFPLGGNKKGRLRTYVNMMIVFVISGFWHGADWSFILWGALHGAVMVFERMAGEKIRVIPKPVRIAVTFLIVNFGWILFAAPDLGSAGNFIKSMFTPGVIAPSPAFYDCFNLRMPFIRYHLNLFVPLLYIVTFAGIQCTKNIYEKKYKPGIALALVTGMLFVFSFLYAYGVSEFIYFKF
ncbi:MAG: MBOAT family protein [Lachnospiraceae bacterium]|nr:MBOAT family protein [Lachnospiraceae bacterium]